MSLKQQQDLIESVGNLGEDLPGLTTDKVIDNLADKSDELKFQVEAIDEERADNIERGMSNEEASEISKAQKEETKSKFKDSIKQSVIETIAFIKQQYKILMDALKGIPESVSSIIANILLPPAVSTPPSGPNPVYAANLTKTNKAILVGVLGISILAFTEILKASNKISYVLPVAVLAIFETLKTLNESIDSITV